MVRTMNFSEKIMKLLVQYRRLIKRQLPAAHYKSKINELGIQRQALRNQNEINLFHIALAVAQELQSLLKSTTQSASWYSGIDEFYQHLQNTIDDYCIEDNKVVHKAHLASRASVEAIQLLTFNNEQVDSPFTERLTHCASVIAKYGTQEQRKLFNNALRKQLADDQPVLKHLEHHFPVTLSCE